MFRSRRFRIAWRARFRPGTRVLLHKYYVDEIYDAVFVNRVKNLGSALAAIDMALPASFGEVALVYKFCPVGNGDRNDGDGGGVRTPDLEFSAVRRAATRARLELEDARRATPRRTSPLDNPWPRRWTRHRPTRPGCWLSLSERVENG